MAATNSTHRARKSRRNWKPTFLKAFASEGTVKAACEKAKVDRKTAYNARQKDEAFALAWFEVEEGVTEELEREGMKRALGGSDRMLEFFLRARAPEKYRENMKVEHGGRVEQAHTVEVPDSDEWHARVAEVYAEALSRRNGDGD
mgnify:CR=1 FL=1